MQFDNNFVLVLFTGEVGSLGLQTVTLSEPFLANTTSHDFSPAELSVADFVITELHNLAEKNIRMKKNWCV